MVTLRETPAGQPDDRLVPLVLAAVVGRPRTSPMVYARLRPWVSSSIAESDIAQTLTTCWRDQTVSMRGSQFRLTSRGKEQVQYWFGGPPIERRGHAGRLVAPALSLQGWGTKLRALARASSLRAEILRQAFALDLEPLPTLGQVEDALAWSLLEFGASPEVLDALPRQSRPRPARLMRAALFWSALLRGGKRIQVEDLLQRPLSESIQGALCALAALHVGADDAEPSSLTRALLNGWLGQTEQSHNYNQDSRPVPLTETPASKGGTMRADGAFPMRALHAARESPTGRFGEHLVLISHAWRHFRATNPDSEPDSLAHFKAQLLDAHLSQLISLKAAEMPQLHNPSDLVESEVRYRASRFHFIRI